jgi:Fe-S-cluster containining protein
LIVSLQRSYRCRYEVPVIAEVDTEIFVRTYFGACMDCTFCDDACCHYGADVSALEQARLEARADELERYLGVNRSEWLTGEKEVEPDWPGGHATRTQLRGDRCVFLNRRGRGCLLHQYALEQAIDVHDLKPMVCTLWPVTWFDQTLALSDEVEDDDIICLTPGVTCYRSARADLAYYFGGELVAELDALEKSVLPEPRAALARGIALPIVPSEA